MRRIAYGIVMLMFLAGTLFAYGCGGEEENGDVDLKSGPDAAEEDSGD